MFDRGSAGVLDCGGLVGYTKLRWVIFNRERGLEVSPEREYIYEGKLKRADFIRNEHL